MILFDTDILIDLLRSHAGRLRWFEELSPDDPVHISVVTKLELLRGCRKKDEREVVREWIGKFEILHLNEQTSLKAEELFDRYFPKQGLSILDSLIAATAICHDLTLYSGNKKHFAGITSLKFKTPEG